jgi:SAM-dependent methyltransferase
VVPPALDARLHHVRGELVAAGAERAQLLGRRHAPTAGRQPVPEDVGDEAEVGLLADGAAGGGDRAHVARRADQLGVRVADLLTGESTDADLVDEHAARQSVVDDAAALHPTAERADRERHPDRVARARLVTTGTPGRHDAPRGSAASRARRPRRATLVAMTSTHDGPLPSGPVSYGPGVPDDAELRLCTASGEGRRVIELGVSEARNALVFAAEGAKAIAVDPDPDRIATLRTAAAAADLRVECHQAELADLGFATSGSVDLVLASGTLDGFDDIGRVLRQVHRVLKPGAPFVIVAAHPFAAVQGADVAPDGSASIVRPYGADGRTMGDWLTALHRSNFRVEVVHELGVSDHHPVPTTLALRVRKEGS